MASSPIAIVAGVGPGTGASVARHFATAYPVVLLSRNPHNYESLVQEINDKGGKAIGISTDLSSSDSLKKTFDQIEKEFPNAPVAAAIFNASGRARKPLLELTEQEFVNCFDISVKGAFLFSQQTLPLLLKQAENSQTKYPPTLIFTGATASVKAMANSAAFASSKFALRALSFSIAKEFAPKGIHVAHAIIDGAIDIPGKTDYRKDMPTDAKIGPDDIAESYWNLHTQSKRCFTNEIDIRPMLEKW